MDWMKILSFAGQHAAVGATAYGIAVSAGQTPKEAAITALVAAVTGATNHAREQSPVAAPAMPATDAPPVMPPANGVPLTNPPIEMPAVDTDAQMQARLMARVRVLYKQYLNRSRSDITNAEMDEAMDLLLAGREDELVRNLNGRK